MRGGSSKCRSGVVEERVNTNASILAPEMQGIRKKQKEKVKNGQRGQVH